MSEGRCGDTPRWVVRATARSGVSNKDNLRVPPRNQGGLDYTDNDAVRSMGQDLVSRHASLTNRLGLKHETCLVAKPSNQANAPYQIPSPYSTRVLHYSKYKKIKYPPATRSKSSSKLIHICKLCVILPSRVLLRVFSLRT